MRLWSLHPTMLDTKGLVALWREALGAQKALIGLQHGQKVGYQSHPQLERFKAVEDPVYCISWYLWDIWNESAVRGFNFNNDKIDLIPTSDRVLIPVNTGQLEYEAEWLYMKVEQRAPDQLWRVSGIEVHPVFREVSGGIEDWERVK